MGDSVAHSMAAHTLHVRWFTRMKTIQRARVISENGRDGRVDSSNGELTIDFSQEGSPNAEHLFAAAYAACFHSALKSAAARAHQEIDGSTVAVEADLVDEGSGQFGLAVEIRASIPGVSRDDAEKLLRQAHQTCPYSKATRNNIEVTLTLD